MKHGWKGRKMESVLTPKDKKCHFGLGSGIQEIQEIENKKQTEN